MAGMDPESFLSKLMEPLSSAQADAVKGREAGLLASQALTQAVLALTAQLHADMRDLKAVLERIEHKMLQRVEV